MTRPILILTAGFGEGHNAAARALAAAVERTLGPGTAHVADAFALASPRAHHATRRFYLALINDAPRLWSTVYDWIDRTQFLQRRLWLFRREIRTLASLIETDPPLAICCTYPLYGFFLEHLASLRGEHLPTFNVVTDSISIHSLWWRARCDGWFLPNPDSADVLRAVGIPDDALHVRGFPVPAFFAQHAGRLSPPDLATGARPRVLHLINSGLHHAFETARLLLEETNWEITCAVGHDSRLRQRLERLAARRPHPTTILGWTDRIPHLLMTHHVAVSKAGGATTQEAIAALCPLVINQVVPGQEEGNYDLLRRHRAGAFAPTPHAVLTTLQTAFAQHGRLWREWRAALRPLARPNAADDIARHVLAFAQRRTMPARNPVSSR
jgi:UDP-N-acetylglucosamine:LPS N-acetylglucosamine transferase